jgi:hypothetical protein
MLPDGMQLINRCLSFQVTSLFQAFSKNKLNPVSASDEEPNLANFIREINSYNRRYSGEPKPVFTMK